MQRIKDVMIKKGQMLVPVFLCLIFIACCFIFLTYMIQKNEKEDAGIFFIVRQSRIRSLLRTRWKEIFMLLRDWL